MLTWTMAHPWMTFFLLALMVVGLVVIAACICSAIEKVISIKHRPSALERLLTAGNDEKSNNCNGRE